MTEGERQHQAERHGKGKDCGHVPCDVCGAVVMREAGLMTDFEKGRAAAFEEAAGLVEKTEYDKNQFVRRPGNPVFARGLRALATLPPTHVMVEREALREALRAWRYFFEFLDENKVLEGWPDNLADIIEARSALAALDAVEVGK